MVHVIDNLYIDIDSYSFLLQEDSGKKIIVRGKEYTKWINTKYFTRLDMALEECVNIMVSRKLKRKTYELSEAIKILREERKEFVKLIQSNLGNKEVKKELQHLVADIENSREKLKNS